MIGFDMGGNVIGGPGTLGDPDDESGRNALNFNLFGLAQPNQPVSPISSLVAQVVTPSMVTHNIPTPLNPNAVPTMNDPDEMGPFSSTMYGILDTINNPGPVIEPAYNYVTETLGNIIDLDPPTVIDQAVNAAYNLIGLGPFGTLQDVMDAAVESMDLDDAEHGTSIPGEGLGPFGASGETSSVSPGMGMGGGPDAAQMSLDDFGMSSPPGESVTGFLDPVLDFFNLLETPKETLDYERTNPFGLDLYDDQGNKVPFQAPDDLSAVFDLDTAIASTGGFESAFGPGFQGISPEVDMGAVSQEGGEALQEALAQRAAETIIAQEAARQVTPESNKVTIPVSSGPDIVIDVTPPAPAPKLTGKQAANATPAPIRNPVQIAAASIAKPKEFKKLPKFAQKEIRQGRVPTTGSDYVQDMVRDFFAPPTLPTPRGQRPAGANR